MKFFISESYFRMLSFAADDVSDKSSAFGSRHDLTRVEIPLPDWVVVGESVLVRPYSYSGVIAYVGSTEFASGNWIGVELDAPTGMNARYLFLFLKDIMYILNVYYIVVIGIFNLLLLI